MIISKTPYRISFFGGGSDYPQWYNKFGGTVLSATIDKHIYISCRFLPGFFEHKYRIVWSKIENVNNLNQIQHSAVRKLLKYLKIKNGLEIHYDGDLPARSGMGSSSSFVVGLAKVLYEIKNINLSKLELTKRIIFFEQKIMSEIVGSQDQTAAVFGGFNKIIFKKNNLIKVKSVNSKNNINELNKNLVLIYTGINRTAHKIASTYVKKLSTTKKSYINNIISHVNEGEKLLKTGKIDEFGKLLHSAWLEKKSLSKSVTNKKINELYDHAIKSGALGGKLLGAGGGGFLLMYMKNKSRKRFFSSNKKVVNIPFNFTDIGSKIIFNNLKK